MGRNGKKTAVFPTMVRLIALNVGKVVSTQDLLLGKDPARDAATSYIYKFIKLGYLEPVDGGKVMDRSTKYKVVKPIMPDYKSEQMKNDLRLM
jgi:hypothetical protein